MVSLPDEEDPEYGWVTLNDKLYNRVEPLGQGAYGVVWLIQSQSSGERLVCKDIVMNDFRRHDAILQSIERERSLLEISVHRNIVRFFSFQWDETNTVGQIFMEYCGGGDLYQFCTGEISLTQEAIWKIIFQLAGALAYCHHGLAIDEDSNTFTAKPQWKTIIHRDIKPSNVLVSARSEDDIWIKLCDFGIGKLHVLEESLSGTYIGTREYMAPEIEQDSPKWSIKADIYSLGRTIEKLAKTSPSQQISDIISKCMSNIPGDRPSSLFLLETAGHEVNQPRNPPTDSNHLINSPCNVEGWKGCMFSTIIAVGSIEDPQPQGQNELARRLRLLAKDVGGLDKVTEGPKNDTPLHVAVKTRNYLLAQRLLEVGAEVNALNGNGETPLLLSAELRDKRFLKLLLERNISSDTLAPIENIAVKYYNEELFSEAAEIFSQLAETRSRILGKENLDTLSTMNALAGIYRDQGRLGQAEELFLQVMEARGKVLGEENLDTLRTMDALAGTYRDQGRLKDAEDMFLRVMAVRVKELGKEDPDSLSTMHGLATTYQGQERLNDAEDMFLQVMKGRMKVFGKENPDTLRTMDALAGIYRDQGRLNDAEDMFLQVMEGREKVLGKENPDTLQTMDALARTYRDQGRLNDAENMFSLVMAKVKKKFRAMQGLMTIFGEVYASPGAQKGWSDMVSQLEEMMPHLSLQNGGSSLDVGHSS